MDKLERKKLLEQAFFSRFGKLPTVWVQAPGRVDLMGSHTDYNQGFVMTMTIDRDTWIAARPRDDHRVRVSSLNFTGESEFELGDVSKDSAVPWANYVRGMAKVLWDAGFQLIGFDGLIHSTVPLSSGLSSSAALEMAVGVLFKELSGIEVDPVELALFGQRAENEYVGVNCGILDQYSSVMGKAGQTVFLDCRELTSRNVAIAPGLQVVICDTNAKRNLVGSEYDDRRNQCEKGVETLKAYYPDIVALRDVTPHQFKLYSSEMQEVVRKRCQFILEENQRVLDLEEPLRTGDRQKLGQLFQESYAGASDLFEIGTPAMDMMIEAMTAAPGVIAARQAGAGFGGCMIALVEQSRVEEFIHYVRKNYYKHSGIEAKVYPVRASDGAGAIKYFMTHNST